MKDPISTQIPRSEELSPRQRWHRERPENFSTYAPREVVRRLKVVAAIRDVPLWTIVTDALEQYLQRFEHEHGRLPELSSPRRRSASEEG